MKGNKTIKKGFTLIELLVVIAIIAILSVVVILTLNPAELLRQSRDSNRISDLSVTKSAIAFYLASVQTPNIGTSTCYEDTSSANGMTSSTCKTVFSSINQAGVGATFFTSTAVDGTGWIPINFTTTTAAAAIAGGTPIGSLPHDPVNTDGVHLYAYIASSTSLTFKLGAKMESTKYSSGGSNDVESTDGGSSSTFYEQGTSLSL